MRIPLSDAPLGVRLRLVEVPASAIRLQELGFVHNREVVLVRRGVARGPVVIEIDGARICMRSREARAFWVERS